MDSLFVQNSVKNYFKSDLMKNTLIISLFLELLFWKWLLLAFCWEIFCRTVGDINMKFLWYCSSNLIACNLLLILLSFKTDRNLNWLISYSDSFLNTLPKQNGDNMRQKEKKKFHKKRLRNKMYSSQIKWSLQICEWRKPSYKWEFGKKMITWASDNLRFLLLTSEREQMGILSKKDLLK